MPMPERFQRPTRKAMSRRSGQSGYVVKKGNAYYVRFRLDVPDQAARIQKCVRVCPATGPGCLTKPERQRRAREIIVESGADTEQHFRKVEAIRLGETFEQQADRFLHDICARKRNPIKPATATSWRSHLNWVNQKIGMEPIASVNNQVLRSLVEEMSKAGFAPKTMHNYLQVVKMVVASVVDSNGEELYPRKWNHKFIDLPEIAGQRTPTVTSVDIEKIISSTKLSPLFALLPGSGLRIGEALGLEVGDLQDSVLQVRQGVWNGRIQSPKTRSGVREIDLHSSLAQLLHEFIGTRTSGYIFESVSERPLSVSNIRNRELHPALAQIPHESCGFHAFRRFRVTYLRKQRVPEDLIRFWIGHADESVTDGYSKLREDRMYRKEIAEQVGLGFELNTIREAK